MFRRNAESSCEEYKKPANTTWSIFVVSILGLFLEMLLIRWISTEIRIFAYLQNTVLVVCFLGLGLGCFTSRQAINISQMLTYLSFLVLLLSIPITREAIGKTSELLSVLGDLLIWNRIATTYLWQTLLCVSLGLGIIYYLMFFLLNIFVPIGRLLGRLLDEHPRPIWAYSVNVAGSLLGTWLFVLLSMFYQPPFVWFLILTGLILFFVSRKAPGFKLNLAFVFFLVIFSWLAGQVPGSLEVLWSPYQKLVLKKAEHQKQEVGKYIITVNNVGYQALIDLRDPHIKANPQQYPPVMQGLSQYDIPLLLHPNPQTYLIVGAGAGNDAAGGLRHGVKQITAVEIDPVIIYLGRRYHPEAPYSSSAVQIVNDDARSFFATCKKKYDVITFGLLDSHTTVAMTNARLDHYVYTRESISRAKSLLAEGGIMVLSFEAQKLFIADRIARVLREVFGEEPLVFRMPFTNFGWGGVMFISGDLETAKKQIYQNQRLWSLIEKLKQRFPLYLDYSTKITTDDWPYIYLQTPRIPILYYILAILLLLLTIHSSIRWRASNFFAGWARPHWHFFFLGAAFLLLEVQNISKAAVVLGNTWQVNAVIISGVLVMILLANLVAYRFHQLSIIVIYTFLIGTCLSLYVVDLSRFAFFPSFTKIVIVGGFTTLPMLFSGIIFIRSFTLMERKDEALGANLIGALVGALLQSLTFIVGIKGLLLVVAGLYGLALLTQIRLTGQRQRLSSAAVHYSKFERTMTDD